MMDLIRTILHSTVHVGYSTVIINQ